jgi:hypothetical protein
MALYKELFILPGDGAVVSELAQGLLNQAAVHVQVSPLADDATLLLFEVVVTCKHLASFNVSLDMSEGTVLNEPLGSGGVDLNEVVIDPLVEGSDVGKVLLKRFNSVCQDRSDATEFIFSSSMCPLEGLLNRLLHVENVSRHEPSLCHKQGLVASLREVFKNPTILGTVLHLNPLHDQADECVIL